MEEGVDEALGDVDLGGRPLVDEAVVGGAVVVDVVALGHVPHGEGAEDGQGKAQQPQPGAGAAPDAEVEEEPAQDEDHQGQNHGLGEEELVLPRHVAGLLQKEQVLEHEGVVAELELEPAAHGEAQSDGGGEAVGQSGPTQDKVEQEVEEHHRGQVQKGDEGVLEVAQKHGLLVDDGGEDQAHKAYAQSGAQAPEEVPCPEEGRFPHRPLGIGVALEEGDFFHDRFLFHLWEGEQTEPSPGGRWPEGPDEGGLRGRSRNVQNPFLFPCWKKNGFWNPKKKGLPKGLGGSK